MQAGLGRPPAECIGRQDQLAYYSNYGPRIDIAGLLATARNVRGNTTPVLSATDLSPGDQGTAACTSGYCHLGGSAVGDREAFGAGVVDAGAAVGRR